jgi:hypothetical protein
MNNRDTLYVVLRHYGMLNQVHVLDTCRTLQRAEELADAYTQDFADRNIVGFKFSVQVSHFVDE